MTSFSRSRIAPALVCAALAFPAAADTLRVPQQHATIQAAINAAQNGDTVLVAPGTYSGAGNRDLNLLGKAITVRSANGAATCTINAGGTQAQPHCGFTLTGNLTRATVIDGFTITGGHQFNGGGILVQSGSPTVQNCVVTGNAVDCWGGGVYAEGGSSPRIVNTRIFANSSTDEGGGVFIWNSTAVFENCRIDNNTAIAGGGVCGFNGSPTFVNCTVNNNTAQWYGGGFYIWGGSIINCTVANNTASYMGSGVFVGDNTTVTNSIVWSNTGADAISTYDPATTHVTYSCVEGGYAGVGNISAEPQFVNPYVADFRLMSISPAIDAGLNSAVPAGVSRDLAGNPRITDFMGMGNRAAGAVVDMGAFETRGRTLAPAIPVR